MKSRIFLKGAHSVAILGVLVCVIILAGCGSGAGGEADKVDNKGVVAANSPTPPVPSATATDKAIQQGSTETRNNSAAVSKGPKPQIGTGGNDFFQFTQARAAISADPELKAANIVIDVKSGVLTLSGTVASAAQKSKAEQLARAAGGVKEVSNRLRISN